MDSDTQQGTATKGAGVTRDSSAGSENRRSLTDQIRGQAADRFSGEKDRALKGLTSLVEAARQTGRQLRENDQAGIATYIDSAADQAAKFSERLGNKDLTEIVDDMQRFGRSRPAMFLGLGFGLGMIGARFFKSSRPHTYANRLPAPTSGTGFGPTDRPAAANFRPAARPAMSSVAPVLTVSGASATGPTVRVVPRPRSEQ